MRFKLVGKSLFTSKKGSICTALHLIDAKPLANGVGNAVTTKVTTVNCANVELGMVEVTFNDRGFIESITKA